MSEHAPAGHPRPAHTHAPSTDDPAVEQLYDDATGDIAIGDLPAAIKKFRRCVELQPDFFDGWHALGMALMKNGQIPEAIQAGLRCVQLRPNDQLAWSSLSLFYVRNGQIKEAESAGTKARILSWGAKIAPEPPASTPAPAHTPATPSSPQPPQPSQTPPQPPPQNPPPSPPPAS